MKITKRTSNKNFSLLDSSLESVEFSMILVYFVFYFKSIRLCCLFRFVLKLKIKSKLKRKFLSSKVVHLVPVSCEKVVKLQNNSLTSEYALNLVSLDYSHDTFSCLTHSMECDDIFVFLCS